MNVSWKDFLLSPNGRVARQPFNVFFLGICFITVITFFCDYLYLGDAAFQKDAELPFTSAAGLILLWPQAVIAIKRLHDLNYRGWWLLAGILLPATIGVIGATLGVIFLLAHGTTTGLVILSFVIAVLSACSTLVFFVVLSCRKGTVGPNRFGSDPLQNPSNENNLVSEGV